MPSAISRDLAYSQLRYVTASAAAAAPLFMFFAYEAVIYSTEEIRTSRAQLIFLGPGL